MTLKSIVHNILRPVETAALEDKLTILKEKWWKLVTQKPSNITKAKLAGKYSFPSDIEALWLKVVDADPTKNKAYLQWMILKVFSSPIWLRKMYGVYREDLNMLSENLAMYDRLKITKELPPEIRDINQIKNDTDLFDKLQPFKEVDLRSQREKGKDTEQAFFDKKEAILFHDSAALKIVIPKTHEASCYFGVNTKWCTTSKNDLETFEDYAADGPLFIVLHKPTNRRWQFHFETAQFMDERDHFIKLVDFYKEPFIKELREVFDIAASEQDFIPFMISYTVKEAIRFLTNSDYVYDFIDSKKPENLLDLFHVKPVETEIKDILFTAILFPKLKINRSKITDMLKALTALYGKPENASDIVKEHCIRDVSDYSLLPATKFIAEMYNGNPNYTDKALKIIANIYEDERLVPYLVKYLTFTDEQWMKMIKIEHTLDVAFVKSKGKDIKEAIKFVLKHFGKKKGYTFSFIDGLYYTDVINKKLLKELFDEKIITKYTFDNISTVNT